MKYAEKSDINEYVLIYKANKQLTGITVEANNEDEVKKKFADHAKSVGYKNYTLHVCMPKMVYYGFGGYPGGPANEQLDNDWVEDEYARL
jgi:hypothetical protein